MGGDYNTIHYTTVIQLHTMKDGINDE